MNKPIRPSIRLLGDALTGRIIDEAYDVLARLGVYVENPTARNLFADGGSTTGRDRQRVLLPRILVERALGSAPQTITLWDATGERSFIVGDNNVHFDPGSAALHIFDHARQTEREPSTSDVIQFHRLVQRLDSFHFQSTGLISADVSEKIADCHRLWIALQHCTKPVVTGTFVVEGFAPMAEMLRVVRGGSRELQEKPLAIFDACPSPPLRWSNLTAQSVIDCAREGIPSELVAMPMTGATAPVTITGALVQHTAENLAGVVLSQIVRAGAPVIFGGSPSSFDMRAGTPPMGAIETMMIDIGYVEVGKTLGLPTHAYMGLSDAKCVDAQAGLESGIGAILAALAGVNVVSGAGMMDYENCQSPEKLVIDNEICRMAYRLIDGVLQRDEPMAFPILEDALGGADFLSHPHTVQWHRREHGQPSVIDRGNAQQWAEAGRPTLADRAAVHAARLLSGEEPPPADSLREELTRIMKAHAQRLGV